MADLKISELSALAGVDLVAADQLAVADASASETKRITVTDLVGNATTLIADATIPGAKILFGSQQIAGSALINGAVDTAQLADDGVTAAKLGDQSTVDLVTTLPASGAFVGQIALDTDDNKIYCWDGSNWQSVKGAGSVNTVIGGSTGIVNVTVATVGDEVTINTTLDNTSAAAQFLAGPSDAAGAVDYRAIASADLPTATTSSKGAVSVNGEGLRLDQAQIEIDNDITESAEYHVVTYTSKGLVSAGRLITSADMPAATSAAKGAVTPGTGLDVDVNGVLNHSNSVVAGDYAKVTVDAQGHVSVGTALVDTDIPDLDASKITSGELPTARIADDAIVGTKLANYSTSKIADSAPAADYIGQLFFNPLDRTLFMWDGNVYQPVGVSYGQVVFSGTYDAGTNLITSVTPDGAAIGLAVGAALVSPVAANRAHYVVVDQPGTGVAPAPTVSLSPPDILLSTGSDWILLDVSDTVTAQLASNIQVTPAGNIASSNVQAALQELDTEKLALAGGTLTGNLNLDVEADIVFEGANANANETTLTVADPTADRTITLPDVSGTVVTTGDTGTVTSTMIADGTIVNADINASAAIAGTKIDPDFGSQTVETTGDLAINTDTLFVDASADAVGIGTTSPIADLDIAPANSSATLRVQARTNTSPVPAIELMRGANTTFGADIYADYRIKNDNAQLVFEYAASGTTTERMRIDSSGRLGIGTSSPSVLLHVNESTGAHANLILENSEGSAKLGTNSNIFYVESSQHIFYNSGGSTEYARIDSSGRVGIGTTSPLSIFDVKTSSNRHILITPNANYADNGIVATNDAGSEIALGIGGAPIQFFTGATERARIDSSGNVGIGTTSPNNRLTVIDRTTPIALRIGENDTATTEAGLEIQARNTANTSGYSLQIAVDADEGAATFDFNGSERARIDSSGRLLVGTSSDSGGALLQVNGDRVRIATAKTPASATDTGTAGEVCWDANYVYVCTATNTWKRSALSTW